MRVLQVHNVQHAVGGADRVMDVERENLEALGHQVQRLVLRTDEVINRGRSRAALKAIWNREFERELERYGERFGPHVIHVHTPFPVMSPAVFRVAAQVGAASVFTAHSFRYACPKATLERGGIQCERCVGSRLKLSAVRFACYHDSRLATAPLSVSLALHRSIGSFARIDRMIVLTDYARDLAVREGIDPAQIVVKPNCIQDPGFVRDHPRADAIFVGRLVSEKGVKTLLDAWSAAEMPDLHVYGDGPLRGAVDRAAAGDDRIHVHGERSHEEISAAMRGAACTVVPSEWVEAGVPLVIGESLAVGTPVVASDIGNFSDFVRDRDCGLVFRPSDAPELAATVRTVAATPEQWVDQARSAYEATFSPEVANAGLMAAYESAIEHARRRRSNRSCSA